MHLIGAIESQKYAIDLQKSKNFTLFSFCICPTQGQFV